MIKIALDAMGGDFGPSINVEGAISACREWKDLEVVLVGDQALLTKDIQRLAPPHRLPISIQHSASMVGMDESPVDACRAKPDSSIMTCAKLMADDQVDGLVSAGNSGATMTASLLHVRRLNGIARPAIATIVPTVSGQCVMLDMGANVDCKPKHLLQFAVMGSVYFEAIFKASNPTVGLLSIGEEEGKGNELTQETHHLLKNSGLNYIGNIEGRDIPMGKADVIVCDGFVGNVVLKFGEGLAEAIIKLIKIEVKKHPFALLASLFLRGVMKDIKKKVDPHMYGGAPLLGVAGVSIVSHGGSSSLAIKNAIRVAAELIRDDINKHIESQLQKTSSSLISG